MFSVDFRLKVRHFFKKHRKFIFIVAIIFVLVFSVNTVLKNMSKSTVPTTTYTPNKAVLNSSSKVPDKVADSFETFIDKYFEYCNKRDYKSAYNLISEDCKSNYFENRYENFVKYVENKFTNEKCYAIQNYSNYNDKYIYSVKIFDDFLATGLTNQSYQYQEEMMVASYDENKNIVFSIGNYIETKPLTNTASNDYLKVELKSVDIKYSYQIYEIKLSNRVNDTIVIQDGFADSDEICLVVDGEYRQTDSYNIDIVLEPKETITVKLVFPKFYDSDSTAEKIVFSSVRVMSEYTGVEENAQAEIENAIDKFSMNIPIQ